MLAALVFDRATSLHSRTCVIAAHLQGGQVKQERAAVSLSCRSSVRFIQALPKNSRTYIAFASKSFFISNSM